MTDCRYCLNARFLTDAHGAEIPCSACAPRVRPMSPEQAHSAMEAAEKAVRK